MVEMTEKKQFQLEYLIKTSAKVLYNRLSTPGGLAEWFADDVTIKNDIYSFFWDGSEEKAKMLARKPGEFMRFQWLDAEDADYYFEFKIKVDDLTKEVALIITDHAEENEQDESIRLWDSQVSNLMRILGS
ncbi:MAG: hypothetical protein COA57_07685 [Flavobacteriales bacterium]|nr:MAG: hypothetical protein COA57_07685 [Flavobacteriales bacterium]